MGKKWEFEIMTDSVANLPEDLIEQQELSILPLMYLVDNVEYKGYEKGKEIQTGSVYEMMREGKVFQTSLVNRQETHDLTEELLKAGKDILYVGFSSGLSGTYQVVWSVFQELQEIYPDRTLIAVDSLSASLGEGILVRHAVRMREEGKSISAISEWIQTNALSVCHDFTVEDLFYLKRGGRIGTAAAVLGSALKVKPMLRLDEEGKLIPVGKVRGRKKSLDTLAEKVEKNIVHPKEQEIYITHGDCLQDAEYLADQVRRRVSVRGIQIQVLEPVIGSHSGPGTVGIFYMGGRR